jgi:hypothetical protein
MALKEYPAVQGYGVYKIYFDLDVVSVPTYTFIT